MNHSSPTPASASSLPAGKITRQQVAAHCGLCVRTIDALTRGGVLGHYRIGKSVRYDLAEVEATLRQRFHVGGAEAQAQAHPQAHPQPQEPGQGSPGGATPAISATTTATTKKKQQPKPALRRLRGSEPA
ncbi:helix-turn-helix domain-containing protein [Prosthecobacter sp.]|uniref:helix-turn-helix domain-containing protein n=1 Tax=Prosthecobacter sp. TaxID=1965333 RepID=UPI0037838BE6